MPPLTGEIAQPCPQLDTPAQDYDAWQRWMIEQVLVEYGICAARVVKLQDRWPQ